MDDVENDMMAIVGVRMVVMVVVMTVILVMIVVVVVEMSGALEDKHHWFVVFIY